MTNQLSMSGVKLRTVELFWIYIHVFSPSFRFIQFYINHELNTTGREEIYLLPKCVIEAHASPFLFKKGSYFMKPINNIVSAAVESGLTKFWYTYSTPKTSSQFAKIHPLSIYQLQFAFVILIAGTSVAVLVFLLELQLCQPTWAKACLRKR